MPAIPEYPHLGDHFVRIADAEAGGPVVTWRAAAKDAQKVEMLAERGMPYRLDVRHADFDQDWRRVEMPPVIHDADELRRERAALMRERDDLRFRLDQAIHDIEQLRADREAAVSRYNSARADIDKLESQLTEARDDLSTAQRQIANGSRLNNTLTRTNTRLRDELRKMRAARSDAVQRLGPIARERNALRAENAALRDEAQRWGVGLADIPMTAEAVTELDMAVADVSVVCRTADGDRVAAETQCMPAEEVADRMGWLIGALDREQRVRAQRYDDIRATALTGPIGELRADQER